jgi:glycosyltransferase involved in cell wall biosynthesis
MSAVSVILPVHGSRTEIDRAILSVVSQSFPDWTLAIPAFQTSSQVDLILKKWSSHDKRINVLYTDEPGIPAALNLAISAFPNSKYIARLDSDDIMLPNRLLRQFRYLESHPKCVIVGGQRILLGEKDQVIFNKTWYSLFDFQLRSKFNIDSPFAHPAVMIRGDALKRVGGYRREFQSSEDLDLWFRLLEIGSGHNLKSRVVAYRTQKAEKGDSRNNENIEPWKHIPLLCSILRGLGIQENLDGIHESPRNWCERMIQVMRNTSKSTFLVNHLINRVSQDLNFEGKKPDFTQTHRFIRQKVVWRLVFPFLILRHKSDRIFWNVVSRDLGVGGS